MRAKMKWCINEDDLKENQMLRQQALLYNQHNPYSPIVVPERLREEYAECDFSFKVANVLDYYIEPTQDKHIIVSFYPAKEMVFAYNPLLESKLELHFNGE